MHASNICWTCAVRTMQQVCLALCLLFFLKSQLAHVWTRARLCAPCTCSAACFCACCALHTCSIKALADAARYKLCTACNSGKDRSLVAFCTCITCFCNSQTAPVSEDPTNNTGKASQLDLPWLETTTGPSYHEAHE